MTYLAGIDLGSTTLKAVIYDLAGNVVDEDRQTYELFLGNAAYFFGFGEPASERTYVVTQVE